MTRLMNILTTLLLIFSFTVVMGTLPGCGDDGPPPSDETIDDDNGDGDEPDNGDGTEESDGYQAITVTDGGSLKGKVIWGGADPAAYTHFAYSVASNEKAVCGKADQGGKRLNQTFNLGDAGDGKKGVAGVVVWLHDIKKGAALPAGGTVSFDNHACEFAPHIFLVPSNSTLRVTTSDSVAHNAKVDFEEADGLTGNVFNKQLGAGAAPVTHSKLPIAGSKLIITCSQHYWMGAVGIVHDHPYYAVTKADGSFEIPNIPAGEYTVKMWHEAYKPEPIGQSGKYTGVGYTGEWDHSAKVKIEKGKAQTLDVTFN